MALPFSDVQNVFTAAVLTATKVLTSEVASAAAVQLNYTTSGFSGTLDIQGCLTAGGTFVNLPYVIIVAGSLTPAVAQISHTTNTATWQLVVLAPMPFMKVVMTRSAGTLTSMDARVFSEPFRLALVGA